MNNKTGKKDYVLMYILVSIILVCITIISIRTDHFIPVLSGILGVLWTLSIIWYRDNL
jgi:uncharacterized membrane protein